MHSIGYVHGDVKPCNILIGKHADCNIKIKKGLPNCKIEYKKLDSIASNISINEPHHLLLKPINPKHKSQQMLFLIDFGISTKYVDIVGRTMPQKIMRSIRCSPQYAGLN
jgi:serine/threonine protein kinase